MLCAAYNLKNPDKTTTPDDKLFDRPSTIIVGLDRLILQTVGFDFRVRHPQKLLVKLVRHLGVGQATAAGDRDRDARAFFAVAYPMSIDLYKTFAPIKQTSFTMALAVIELTARVLGQRVDAVRAAAEGSPSSSPALKAATAAAGAEADYHTSRGCVVETLLDLLDLYTQFTKSTKVGPRFVRDRFIDIKIQINQEVEADPALRRIESWCDKCAQLDDRNSSGDLLGAHAAITPGSVTSPATTGSGTGGAPAGGTSSTSTTTLGLPSIKPNQKKVDGTMRFLFEADKMRQEQIEVAEYYKEDYVEEEMEVEEPVPEPSRGGQHNNGNNGNNGNNNNNNNHNNHNNNNNNNRGNGPRRDRNNNHGGGGNGDAGWSPYQRNRNNDHRQKPRKGGGGGGGGGYYWDQAP